MPSTDLRTEITSLLQSREPVHELRLLLAVTDREAALPALEVLRLWDVLDRIGKGLAVEQESSVRDWLAGLSEGLTYWARAAKSADAWAEAAFLRWGLFLWQCGYPLAPGSTFRNARESLEHLTREAGTRPLAQGEGVARLLRPVQFLPRLDAETVLTLERSLRSRREGYLVEQVYEGSARIRHVQSGETDVVPRTLLWPSSCAELARRRENFVRYASDALAAALAWSSGEMVDVEAFYEGERSRLMGTQALWICESDSCPHSGRVARLVQPALPTATL